MKKISKGFFSSLVLLYFVMILQKAYSQDLFYKEQFTIQDQVYVFTAYHIKEDISQYKFIINGSGDPKLDTFKLVSLKIDIFRSSFNKSVYKFYPAETKRPTLEEISKVSDNLFVNTLRSEIGVSNDAPVAGYLYTENPDLTPEDYSEYVAWLVGFSKIKILTKIINERVEIDSLLKEVYPLNDTTTKNNNQKELNKVNRNLIIHKRLLPYQEKKLLKMFPKDAITKYLPGHLEDSTHKFRVRKSNSFLLDYLDKLEEEKIKLEVNRKEKSKKEEKNSKLLKINTNLSNTKLIKDSSLINFYFNIEKVKISEPHYLNNKYNNSLNNKYNSLEIENLKLNNIICEYYKDSSIMVNKFEYREINYIRKNISEIIYFYKSLKKNENMWNNRLDSIYKKELDYLNNADKSIYLSKIKDDLYKNQNIKQNLFFDIAFWNNIYNRDTIKTLAFEKKWVQEYIQLIDNYNKSYFALTSIQTDLDRNYSSKFIELLKKYESDKIFFDDEIKTQKEKYQEFLKRLNTPSKPEFAIDSIQVEFHEDNLKNIIVIGTWKNEPIKFVNLTPIPFSTLREYNFYQKLYSFNYKSAPEDFKYWIKLGDIIKYLPKFYPESESYGPKDTAFFTTPEKKVTVLRKEKIDKILDARIYSDFIGLGGDNPNGLVQAEVSRKIILRPKRQPVYTLGQYSFHTGRLNFFEPIASITKIEKNFKELPLTVEYETTQDSKTVKSKHASTLDLLRYSNFSFGGKVNLSVFDFPKLKYSLYLNIGTMLYRTLIKDSVRTITAGVPDEAIKKSYNVSSLVSFAEVLAQIKPDYRFGVSISAKISYLDVKASQFGQVLKSSDVTSGPGYWMYNFKVDTFLNPTENGKLFFRVIYNTMVDDLSQGFFQAQLGYSFNILKHR